MIAAEKNRVEKYLKDANVKLSSVATDIFGVSGREILKEIIRGNTDGQELSELARGRLKRKKEEIKKSLNSRITEHHRMMIEFSLKHIECMEELLAGIDKRIDEVVEKNGLKEAVELLDTIPGVDKGAGKAIMAEIGADMSKFPTEKHLASWGGMSPGNNESAGKKKSGKTLQGNKWLKSILVQCALSAARTNGAYLKDKYHRLASRRGKKKAALAIGHKILVSAYHMLKHKIHYKELGIDYLDKRNKEKIQRHYINKLNQLGYEVSLVEKQVA